MIFFAVSGLCQRNQNLTNELPLSVRYETRRVSTVCLQLEIYCTSVICPRAKFHGAFLVIKRKPGDVDFAGAEEESGWNPQTVAVGRHHNIGRVRAVDVLIGAKKQRVRFLHCGFLVNHMSFLRCPI